jgi:hypothetical protein
MFCIEDCPNEYKHTIFVLASSLFINAGNATTKNPLDSKNFSAHQLE